MKNCLIEIEHKEALALHKSGCKVFVLHDSGGESCLDPNESILKFYNYAIEGKLVWGPKNEELKEIK